jgi:Zn-dependent M28 family amino/carboxypeptidase
VQLVGLPTRLSTSSDYRSACDFVEQQLRSFGYEGTAGSPAPGADDDGSGSAGVLEIARVLKDQVGHHDLILILFGGEEQGLLGSRHFVRSLSAAQRSRVRAVVTMDMIETFNTPLRLCRWRRTR